MSLPTVRPHSTSARITTQARADIAAKIATEYDDLKAEYKMHDDGDGYGCCMYFLFPIAIELDLREDSDVPADWQYRAGALGSHHEPDCYVAECLQQYSSETILQFGNVLTRYKDKLHVAGKTY